MPLNVNPEPTIVVNLDTKKRGPTTIPVPLTSIASQKLGALEVYAYGTPYILVIKSTHKLELQPRNASTFLQPLKKRQTEPKIFLKGYKFQIIHDNKVSFLYDSLTSKRYLIKFLGVEQTFWNTGSLRSEP